MPRPAMLLLPLLPLVALAAAPRLGGFSLDRRVALTSSRVDGWPDPPPPYRTRRVFEKQSFRAPVHLVSHPAHDLVFVVEQRGRIVHLAPNRDGKVEEFLQLKDAETYSLAFHPQYRTNRLVYVFSNSGSKTKKYNRILRYKTVGDPVRCDPASRQLVIEWESNGHNGGDLGFGRDGMLYITAGDGTSDSDTDNTGQDLRDLCSGVLRIDVDRPASGKGYAVPPDNPFVKLKGASPELWAFGFRNPWRMTFDPTTGELLIGDVGQDLWEMIRLVTKGSNHGWSATEGTAVFHPNRTRGPGPIVPPLIEHPHSESRSITGGVVYQGKKLPELRGVYVYGDYSTGKVWGLKHKDGKVTWKRDLALTRLQIVGIGADRDGEVYLVDHTGQVHQLEPSPPQKGPSTFPRALSESGLYLSVAENRLHPSLIPYEVNSPLWSDGADKERAIALPGLETIGFDEKGAWKFPEKTVLVKTFSLEMADGKKRRIETRFLTLQQGEWYGYSYAWGDDGRDAQLVDAGGVTRNFLVKDGAGQRQLAWRFPSRVECMVCHTRAATYVLGVNTAQLNRDHDYAGTRRNQLEAMERLGIFLVPRVRHRDMLQETGRGFGQVLATLTQQGPMAPFAKCCTVPLAKEVQKRYASGAKNARRAGERRGDTPSRLPGLPAVLPRLADPADESAPLEARVRSYLHANCAHCHVWAGGGNSAINLHVKEPLDKMKLVGEAPLHDRFGLADAKLVAPGAPERSILQERLKRRGKGQMPPLGSSRVDDLAVRLIREWIRQLR